VNAKEHGALFPDLGAVDGGANGPDEQRAEKAGKLFESGPAAAAEESAGAAGDEDLFGAEFEFRLDGEDTEGDDEPFAAEAPSAQGRGQKTRWDGEHCQLECAAEGGEAEGDEKGEHRPSARIGTHGHARRGLGDPAPNGDEHHGHGQLNEYQEFEKSREEMVDRQENAEKDNEDGK
jgi:hypothetical protein